MTFRSIIDAAAVAWAADNETWPRNFAYEAEHIKSEYIRAEAYADILAEERAEQRAFGLTCL